MPDSEILRRLLRESATAVLALASGGCGRYIFSTEVSYVIGPNGWPVLTYESPNPFHHQLLARSGLHFVVDVEKNPDGSDRSRLVLSGKMTELDPAGDTRRYVFRPEHAYLSLETGEQKPIALPELLC